MKIEKAEHQHKQELIELKKLMDTDNKVIDSLR